MKEEITMPTKPEFLSPRDGDVLNDRDGVRRDGALYVPVRFAPISDGEITVMGVPAVQDGDALTLEVPLYGYRNSVTAHNTATGEETRITLFYLPQMEKVYRLSSDDNILFLAELNADPERYKSIFDHPYLAVYREAHERYGAKVHLNLFYETDDVALSLFAADRPYFNLSMMSDRYKDEFRQNADWLRLAFHSRSEFPPSPYRDADFMTVLRDAATVNREIIRFAGEECLGNTTTVHYGAANREGIRALRALGYRSLTGYFIRDRHGRPSVAYYVDGELLDHIEGRDAFYDTAEDILFARIDTVLNLRTNAENLQILRETVADPHRGGLISVMIHEQYFYSDYKNHLSDFRARVLDACAYLYEAGYRGTHLTELFQEPDLKKHPSIA